MFRVTGRAGITQTGPTIWTCGEPTAGGLFCSADNHPSIKKSPISSCLPPPEERRWITSRPKRNQRMKMKKVSALFSSLRRTPEEGGFSEEQPKAKRSKTSNKDSSFIVSEKKPKKLSAKTPSRPRGGKLRNLMLMPVDIFVEVRWLPAKDEQERMLNVLASSSRSVNISTQRTFGRCR